MRTFHQRTSTFVVEIASVFLSSVFFAETEALKEMEAVT